MGDIIEYDYKIITIDSDVSKFKDATVCDFYIKLDEPLRNVYKINIITMLLNITNNSPLITTKAMEQIYVNLNNYSRLIGMSSTVVNGDNVNINAFDSLIIENKITSGTDTTTIKNEYLHTDSIYQLNPINPQLNRFIVKLIDKNNTTIPMSSINRFVMKIGVYYNNKKTTRI